MGLSENGTILSVRGPAFEMGSLQKIIQKGFRILCTTELGIKNTVGAILVQAHTDEVGCPYFTDLPMDGVIAIRK